MTEIKKKIIAADGGSACLFITKKTDAK